MNKSILILLVMANVVFQACEEGEQTDIDDDREIGMDSKETDLLDDDAYYDSTEIRELATPAQDQIFITDRHFNPKVKIIEKGMELTWINIDGNHHTIISENDLFSSKDLRQGQTFSYTFQDTGTYNYYDRFYPVRLKGKVKVVEDLDQRQ